MRGFQSTVGCSAQKWIFRIAYSELLEVRECGKVTEGASTKQFGSELARGETAQVVPDLPDEWKQLKVVWFSEWVG